MTGRFTVSLTVEYGNDPQAICDLLEQLARDHEKVLEAPGPGAVFSAFSATGLTFDLRGLVANVFDVVFVASDLRIKIDEALKARGVRMATPYPLPPLEVKP
jgi:potassium-dependent mechanosensitive channel